MTTRDSFRLLYLGFAFPPGVQSRFPGINPAGHRFETEMITALRRHFEIRSVGLLPFEISAADARLRLHTTSSDAAGAVPSSPPAAGGEGENELSSTSHFASAPFSD